MWVIIGSDGDVDYTNVYGPFTTVEEADAKCDLLPPDNGDIAYRVELIQSVAELDKVVAEQEPDDDEVNFENEDFVVPLVSNTPQEYNPENTDFIVSLPSSEEYAESKQAAEDRILFGDDMVNMLGMALGAIKDASTTQGQSAAANRAIDLMMDMEEMDEDNFGAKDK